METNKRKRNIIIAVFIILMLLGIWFFFFLNKSSRDDLINGTKNLFPFGQIDIGQPNQNNQNNQENQENNQETEEIEKETRTAGPRLRQVSFVPTGGFAPMVRVDKKDIIDITINADGTKTESEKTIEVKNNYVRYSVIDDATFYESYVDPYEIKEELLVENYIPNAEHVFFSKDGNNTILQYWNKKERKAESYLARISKTKLKVNKCPYDFSKPIKVDDDSVYVYKLHEFLNKNPLTRIAVEGMNSPGNESSRAVPATITAIKNFQSLYELDIDGELGPATQEKMLSICNAIELKKAKERFKKLKRKYEINGFFLPQGIVSLDISPDGNNFFYIEKDKLGSVGILKSFDGSEGKTIFESTYSEWLSQWNSEKNIQLTTKASNISDGFTYGLNPKTGDYHKSLRQQKGLTALASPNNKKIFVHKIENGAVKNFIFDKKTYRERDLTIQTFPEKCTWKTDSTKLYCLVPNSLSFKEKYPDTWYQGMETYSDSLYEIDGRTGKAELISDFPIEYNKDLDIFKIGIDENNDYLYFIDKKTEFLWSYRLLNV